MTEPLGLDALRERLREYDPSLPRCKQRITRAQNCAPDFVPEEERAEWDMVTYVPCCRPEGHEGKCRSTRLVLGFPGYDTLTALVAEVERLRAQRVLDNEEAARLYDFARDKGAALERDATVAWLRSEPEKGVACDGHRHANGGSCVVFTDMTAPDLADAIERGDHRLIDLEKP